MRHYLALALLCAPALASAQTPPQARTYRNPGGSIQSATGIFCVPALDGSGCADSPPAPATSTPATGTVTTTSVTATSGPTPTFAAGTATIPFTPTAGRDIYLSLAITGGSASVTVVAAPDGICANGYSITQANAGYVAGVFTNLAAGRYREDLGTEMQVGTKWCALITPGAGATVNYGVSQ